MACLYKCDGCGKEKKANEADHRYFKPSEWFQRSDEDGIQDACSRECVEAISKKTGKTSVVLPI